MIIGVGKPWAYDPEWVTAQALQPANLMRVLLDSKCTPPFGKLPMPWWWFSLPSEVQISRKLHGIGAVRNTVLWCPSRKQQMHEYRGPHMLTVHQPTGQWMDHEHRCNGVELLGLVQRRHGISQAKAAWRVAKLLGYPRPMSPT